jgi:uncharacterized protein (DUF924 family)
MTYAYRIKLEESFDTGKWIATPQRKRYFFYMPFGKLASTNYRDTAIEAARALIAEDEQRQLYTKDYIYV